MDRSVSFVIEGRVDTQVTITEVTELVGGELVTSLQFDLVVLGAGPAAKLRGFYFDMTDPVAAEFLSATPTPEHHGEIRRTKFSPDEVTAHGWGTNENGKAAETLGGFDAGVEFVWQDLGADNWSTSFVLQSSEGSLSLDMIDQAEFGVRFAGYGKWRDGKEHDGATDPIGTGVPQNDTATVDEDSDGIVIDLMANDSVATGGVLSIDSFDFTGLQGTVIDHGDGTITYLPDGAFDGLSDGESAVDSFRYTTTDGLGGTATANVAVTVIGVDEVAPDPVGVVGTFTMGAVINIGSQPVFIEGRGRNSQSNEVEAAGHIVARIEDLPSYDLSTLDVLYVNNPSNGSFDVNPQDPYGAEFLAALDGIEAAVADGMTLVIHDRHVQDAQLILPGGDDFAIVRETTQVDDIDLLADAVGTIDQGPGGTLTDTTLDGGWASNHGYAIEGSLPENADLFLGRGEDGQIVTFGYKYGEGYVIYSSIPLDYYTMDGFQSDSGGAGGPLTQAEAELYAANLIDFAVDVSFDLYG